MRCKSVKNTLIALAMGMIAYIMLMIMAAVPAYAETTEPDWDYAVTCYFTVTDRGDFIKANDKPIALDELRVPYFDLENYGMQDLYYNPDCYSGGSQRAGTKAQANGHVTVLHLFIYATEIYRCGLDPEEAGRGYLYENNWPYFRVYDMTPGSAFVRFWEFAENINYYVNYEYPLGRIGWGSTCDQIEISDGDVISVKYDANKGEEIDGTYHLFNDGEITKSVLFRNFTPVTLYKTEKTSDYSGTPRTNVGEGHVVKVQKEIGGEVLVSGTTNSHGDVRLDTSRLPRGTYYITSETKGPAVMKLRVYSDSESDGLITDGLENKINESEEALDSVKVSADGKELKYGEKYILQEDKDAFSDSILSAKDTLEDSSSGQTEIDTAFFALDDALTAFKGKVKTADSNENIINIVDDIPEDVSIEDKSLVEEARDALDKVDYDGLDTSAKNAYDLAKAKIEAAEAKIEALEAEAEKKEAEARAEEAEKAREAAEKAKAEAEQAKEAAENVRAEAEKKREAEEKARIEAEKAKEALEKEKLAAEERARASEEARIKAEAGTAAKEAQEAVTKVNTLATVARVSFKKVKGLKKKLAVSWKKVKGAKGYELTIARNKKFTKSALTFSVRSGKTSKTIKKLAKGKYYVKIRAFKNYRGNTLYGKWSKVKKAKIK